MQRRITTLFLLLPLVLGLLARPGGASAAPAAVGVNDCGAYLVGDPTLGGSFQAVFEVNRMTQACESNFSFNAAAKYLGYRIELFENGNTHTPPVRGTMIINNPNGTGVPGIISGNAPPAIEVGKQSGIFAAGATVKFRLQPDYTIEGTNGTYSAKITLFLFQAPSPTATPAATQVPTPKPCTTLDIVGHNDDAIYGLYDAANQPFSVAWVSGGASYTNKVFIYAGDSLAIGANGGGGTYTGQALTPGATLSFASISKAGFSLGQQSGTVTISICPKAPPQPDTIGTCENGDFFCDFGRGTRFTVQLAASDNAGFVLSELQARMLAEPGAWRWTISGTDCQNRTYTNGSLNLTATARETGTPFLFQEIPYGNGGWTTILHIPLPDTPHTAYDQRHVDLGILLGSFRHGDGYDCTFTAEKLENNNMALLPNGKTRYTIYTASPFFGRYEPFALPPNATASGVIPITQESDPTWPVYAGGITQLSLNGDNVYYGLCEQPSCSIPVNAGMILPYLSHYNIASNRMFFELGPYLMNTPTATLTRIPSATSTPIATATIRQGSTATPTRTATPTASATATASATVTGTPPVTGACALSTTYNIPVAPGVITLTLNIGVRFVLADNPIKINYGSQAIDINPGSYEWQQASADYVLYSLTGPARLLLCVGDSASATPAPPTMEPTTEDGACIPADPVPAGIPGTMPYLGILVPTLRTLPTVTATVQISLSIVITTVATLQANISTPAAALETATANYSYSGGQTLATSWTAHMTPALAWLAILNPSNPAWQNGPLWAIAPIAGPIMPLAILGFAVILIRFVQWFIRWLFRIIELIPFAE